MAINDPDLVRRWQENRAMNMRLCWLVDELIGRLPAVVEDRGMLENTVSFSPPNNHINDPDCPGRVIALQEMLIDRIAAHRIPPIQGRMRQ